MAYDGVGRQRGDDRQQFPAQDDINGRRTIVRVDALVDAPDFASLGSALQLSRRGGVVRRRKNDGHVGILNICRIRARLIVGIIAIKAHSCRNLAHFKKRVAAGSGA
jgi:hypothetical protein